MAKPAGHKANCKCVACSPATRARGQAALAASRGGKPRKNPAPRTEPATTAKPKRKTAARKNPSAPQVVVVQAPPPAAPKRRAPRRNPAPAAPAARPRKNPAQRACPHLPSDLKAGDYLVLCTQPGDGGRLRPVKTFQRVADANAFARELPSGSKAMVLEARTIWG